MIEHPLQSVLRLAGHDSALGQGFQRFFRKGDSPPLRSRPMLAWGYAEILVRPDHRVSCVGPRCLITTEKQQSVEFQIDYTAWVERTDTEVAAGKFELKRPLYELVEEGLTSSLRRLLIDSAQNGDGLLNFFAQQSKIHGLLKGEVYQRYGVRIEPRVFPVLEEHLTSFTIHLDRLAIRPYDCNSHFDCICKAELAVANGARMAAILDFRKFEELKELFSTSLQEAISSSITIDKLIFDSYRFRTEATLRSLLNEKFREIGREVSFLSVEITNKPELREELSIPDHETDCMVGEIPIRAKHKLILKLENAGQCLRLSTDLSTWVKGQLDDVSRRVLFVQSVADLIESSVDYSGKIVEELQSRLSQFGYSVSQFSSIAEFEQRNWFTQGVRIVGKTFSNLQSSLDPFTVGVTVSANVRFKSLKDANMTRYLQPGSSLPADVEQTILAAISEDVKRISLLEFYTCFYQGSEGAPSIQARLQKIIVSDLKERFSLAEEGVAIVVHLVKTGLQEKILHLTTGPHTLAVTFDTLADGGDFERVKYWLPFSLRFDSQHFSQIIERQSVSKEQELEEIKKHVERLAIAYLGTIPCKFSAYSGEKAEGLRGQLEEYVEQRIGPEVAIHFGFAFRLRGLGRGQTPMEAAQYQRKSAIRDLLFAGEVGMVESKIKHDQQFHDALRRELSNQTTLGSDTLSEDFAARRNALGGLEKEYEIRGLRQPDTAPPTAKESAKFLTELRKSAPALSSSATHVLLGEGSES